MGRPTRGVVLLMVVHLAVWLLIPPLGEGFYSSMTMSPGAVLSGEVWRLVTSIFAVASLGTLVWALLALFFLAPAVEQRLGMWGFIKLYLLSGIAAASLFTLVGVVVDNAGLMAGPWSSDLAILAAFAFMMRDARILLFFALPIKAFHLLVFAVVIRLLNMWEAQAFLWNVACEMAGIGVAWLMTGSHGWRLADFNPVERFRNWRYRRRMRSFTIHTGGGRSDPSQYLH